MQKPCPFLFVNYKISCTYMPDRGSSFGSCICSFATLSVSLMETSSIVEDVVPNQ